MRKSWKDNAQLMSREELAQQVVPYLTHKNRKGRKREKDQNKNNKKNASGSRTAARHKSNLHKLGLTGSKLATAVKQKLAVKKAWEQKLALEAEASKKVRGRGTGRGKVRAKVLGLPAPPKGAEAATASQLVLSATVKQEPQEASPAAVSQLAPPPLPPPFQEPFSEEAAAAAEAAAKAEAEAAAAAAAAEAAASAAHWPGERCGQHCSMAHC